VLSHILTEEHIATFRAKLRERLEGKHDADLHHVRAEVTRLKRATARFLALLNDVPDDDALELQYRETLSKRRSAEQKLQAIEEGLALVDKESIERQIAVNPIDLLPQLFAPDAPVEKSRAVLTRVFSVIQFMGKTNRNTSIFCVQVKPGAIAAEMTDTPVVECSEIAFKLELSTSAKRPTVWTIKDI
jgi:hypothetical protein